ncbi:MAG: L-rhamnose/proton symporter RhaT [Planctomycetota bacterium]|jgi:L-rhamnose-H+ transport protein
MGTTVVGFALLLLGAVCGGSFGLPSKFVRKGTPWETLWGPFFFFVTILIPTCVFPFIADGLFATCADAGTGGVLMPVLFGFLWGLGSMTLGISFALIGLSLAYALNYGAQIVTGGMGPFIIHHSDQLTTAHGYTIMAGVAVCILGVIVCGRAATLKSKSQAGESEGQTVLTGGKLIKGLIVAIGSGVLCACYGIAVSYGGAVTDISVGQYGNPGWRAAFVVAALILWGGSISACGYCIYKLCVNKTWNTLAQPGIGRILLIALVMACLHDGAILFLGVGVPKLGTQTFGAAVAYPVFMSFAIIVGNINGFLTKEWKGAGKQSVYWIITGIIILIVGVSILAKGNAMHGEYEKSRPASTEQS